MDPTTREPKQPTVPTIPVDQKARLCTRGTNIQSQPATRSSARIRTKRDLENAPDPAPQQKKRKRGGRGESAAITTKTQPEGSSFLPTYGMDTNRKTEDTTRLMIRIPAIKFNCALHI